jgi:hypothetical protein
MSSVGLSVQRILSILAIAGSVITALPMVALAQGNPGLTIFSGVDRENELGFHLNDGRPNRPDRYYLRIPADKMNLAVDQFTISYPDTYRGRFDPDRVEIRIQGDSIPLNEVIWDQENRVVEIYPETPVPAGTRVELVLSNVRNPSNVGTHYFNALVRSPGDLPLLRYVGTWILTIGDN